jgi:hypothetical protein
MDTSDSKTPTTEKSSLNYNTTTPTTINLANIPTIDDETNSSEQQQRKQQTDETTTTDDDDDEQTQLKRLKANNEQIETPVEDEDEEQQDEVKLTKKIKIKILLIFICRKKKNIMKNYKNNFMDNNKK